MKPSVELMNEPDAIYEVLQHYLATGSLNLVIGAGVSKSAENAFPSWPILVKRCADAAKFAIEDARLNDNDTLLKVVSEVKRLLGPNNYPTIVKDNLYKDIHFEPNLLKTDLLTAIGILAVGSWRNGSIKNIVNYNFDSVLEWYLQYHGYSFQTIANLPAQIDTRELAVLHPHGFLPYQRHLSSHENKNIIFSWDDFSEANRKLDSFWNQLQLMIYSTGYSLILGMSGADKHVEQLFSHAYQTHWEKRQDIGVIVLPESDRDELNERHRFLSLGLRTLYFNKYNELPEILFKIAQARVQP